jgi:hypothetical protein
MVNSFADWLCNVLVWGAIIAVAALLCDVFVVHGFLGSSATPISALLALAVVAVLASLWPKY